MMNYFNSTFKVTYYCKIYKKLILGQSFIQKILCCVRGEGNIIFSNELNFIYLTQIWFSECNY